MTIESPFQLKLFITTILLKLTTAPVHVNTAVLAVNVRLVKLPNENAKFALVRVMAEEPSVIVLTPLAPTDRVRRVIAKLLVLNVPALRVKLPDEMSAVDKI